MALAGGTMVTLTLGGGGTLKDGPAELSLGTGLDGFDADGPLNCGVGECARCGSVESDLRRDSVRGSSCHPLHP